MADKNGRGNTSERGFASMDEEKQREIASKGGRAAHEKGTAHEFTPDEAREAGRKGGHSVSQNREHMAQIGRRGGQAVSRNREHMAEIGRRGGESSGGARNMSSQDARAGRYSSRNE
jgi:uncharacterized protein